MNEVERLRALLKAKIEGLGAIKAKAFVDGAAADDVNALDTYLKEMEGIERQLDLAIKAEAIEAKGSLPAATTTAPAPTVPAAAKSEFDAVQTLSIMAAGVIKAGVNGDVEKALVDEGYQGFVDHVKGMQSRMTGKAVNTLVSAEGGVLVPTAINGGIVPLLNKASTFIESNPTRVQLVNGRFTQPRGATGATASYVGEGALKPVSTPTFDAINMQSKKIAGIVPLTNEARKWTVGNIEGYVRQDLQNAIALGMDLAGYFGSGVGANPLGILKKTGIQTFTGAFTSATAPTLAEIDTFATGMILKLTTAQIYNRGRWRWLMSYRTAMRIGSMRVGGVNGDFAFPGMQGNPDNFTFYGIPVTVSSQVPTNGGGTTDETQIALIDWNYVLFGEEEAIIMKMSDQASLNVDGAGTMVHLWQQNMFALLAEAEHDFGLRRANAVVLASGIRF